MAPIGHIFGPVLAPDRAKIRSKVSFLSVWLKVSIGFTRNLLFELTGTTLRCLKYLGLPGPYFLALFGPELGQNEAKSQFFVYLTKSFYWIHMKLVI